jgi:hypothetical protein
MQPMPANHRHASRCLYVHPRTGQYALAPTLSRASSVLKPLECHETLKVLLGEDLLVQGLLTLLMLYSNSFVPFLLAYFIWRCDRGP